MELIIEQTHRSVLSLGSGCSSFFLCDHFFLRKLAALQNDGFHSTAWFSDHANGRNSLHTLGGLEFKCKVEFEKKVKAVDLADHKSAAKVSSCKVKAKRNSLAKSVGAKNVLKINEALFSAKSFTDLGLPLLLIDRLEKEGLTVPTEVQSAAIPTISQKLDVVIQSYASSGKAMAYLLPILSEVGPLKKPTEQVISDKKQGIEAVIVAPSRLLGMQIVREVEKLLAPEDKKLVQQLVGGANRSTQS